ncbi:S41 family peptidase [Silvanigrella aquatica]|uniref:Tail specific protease domain-containing protein n=1 Tax=Silvanigrella aquatica TaxID=1915309 RepID=A0A1L4CZ55_9BACT|nr:S41 family peptidase [Silvanigrella aquatica]APJ03228.1 hypothetical protein AXG55_04640 [Silvanigrella aquatica]
MKKLIAVASALCLLACNKKENETTKKFEDFSDYEAPNPKLVNDKQGVKEVTAFMFDNYYVHDKGINGAQLIRDIDVNLPDEEFYNQISNVFAKHGDAHTRFFKPKPFSCRERGIISDSLLFDLANENGNLKLVVNHINFYNAFSENLEYISALAQFEVGDVILSINGEDPIKMIESNSHFSYGANNESKNIFGLRNLLFRKEVIYPKLIENEFKIKIMRNNLEINLPVYSNNECKNEEINSAIGWDLNHYNMMHYFKNESFQNIDKNSEVKFYKFELNENTKYLYILVPSFASEEVILNKDDNFVIRNMLSIQYKIEKQNDINGVLIDVRNNPGGLVEYSDLLAQLFYSTKSNNPFYPMEFYMKANNEKLKVLNRFNKLVYEKNDEAI